MFILKYLCTCTSKISEYVLSHLDERFTEVYRLIFKVGLAYCFKVPSNFKTFLLLHIKHHGLIFILFKYIGISILYCICIVTEEKYPLICNRIFKADVYFYFKTILHIVLRSLFANTPFYLKRLWQRREQRCQNLQVEKWLYTMNVTFWLFVSLNIFRGFKMYVVLTS